MFVLLSLLAVASAAPFYDQPNIQHGSLHPYFSEDLFETQKFWSDFQKEMTGLEAMLNDFYKQFPSTVETEKYENDKFLMTVSLHGFDEDDITVKARDGLVMVQAVNGFNNFLELKSLPENIDPAGSWIYENGLLTLTFSVKKDGEETTTEVTTEGVKDPETMGEEDSILDPEVFRTTERTTEADLEVTTYAVDVRNDVEFVPINYKFNPHK